MLLYAKQHSPRLAYMIEFLNGEMFTDELLVTQSVEEFVAAPPPKINYSEQSLCSDEFHIAPVSILFEHDIRPQSLQVFEWNGCKAFYATGSRHLPFDIFAAIFFLISRYEEYLPYTPDEYGRFPHTQSLAYREGFLDQPLVNNWMVAWQKVLVEQFPDIFFWQHSFKFIPTYDIDMMFAFKGKSWWKNALGFTRSLIKGNSDEAWQRLRVLQDEEKDPYDAYEWLDALHLYCRSKPIYFFLVAQKQQGYDKNLPTDTEGFQDLIKYCASSFKIGLHPSWQSSVAAQPQLLREELEWLEAVADTPISKSRQHYIKFTLPEQFERLLALNVLQDYSMGYGSINGFRASTCSSYNWFNLARNEATELVLYPFCFMDANAYFEQKLTASQAYAELKHYYTVVKRVNGCLITIFHNNFLGTVAEFADWRKMYEIFMKEDIFWDAG